MAPVKAVVQGATRGLAVQVETLYNLDGKEASGARIWLPPQRFISSQ